MEVRRLELGFLLKMSYMIAIGFQLLIGSAVTLMMLIVFAVYTGSGGILTVASAFTTVQLFDVIRVPFVSVPITLANMVQGFAAGERIQKLLERDDIAAPEPDADAENASAPAILVDDASFAWTEAPAEVPAAGAAPPVAPAVAPSVTPASSPRAPFSLSHVKLSVPRGAFVAVVGPVGSGKSSLISALLREMVRARGCVCAGGGGDSRLTSRAPL